MRVSFDFSLFLYLVPTSVTCLHFCCVSRWPLLLSLLFFGVIFRGVTIDGLNLRH